MNISQSREREAAGPKLRAHRAHSIHQSQRDILFDFVASLSQRKSCTKPEHKAYL